MNLYIDRIGMIKETNINFGNMTVLAGENDSGKTTIGKILFSVLIALRNYKEDYEQYFYKKYEEANRVILRKIRYYNQEMYFEARKQFKIINYQYFDSHFPDRESLLEQYISFLKDRQNETEDISFEKEIVMLKKLLDSNQGMTEKKLLKLSLDTRFKKEFGNDLCSKFCKIDSKIILKDELGYISIMLKNEEITDVEWNNFDIETEVIYIESPFILSLKESESLPSRTNHLIKKLKEPANDFESIYQLRLDEHINAQETIVASIPIQNITKGDIAYNIDKDEFFYKRNNTKIQASNIASGIKVLGIIDLLIKNGTLRKGGYLIIDEPEVHLHPEWQIEYVKILLSLSKAGIKVLIATHSPYIVQAVEFYKTKMSVNDVYFYTTKKKDNYSIITECTNDLNQIFEKLADPYEKMIWERV